MSTSQATTATAAPAHTIMQTGLRVGAVLLVIEIVHGIISITPPPMAVNAIFFLVALVLLIFAGMRAASVTGKIGSGSLAGLLAGALLGLGYAVGTTIGTITNFATVRGVYQSAALSAHIPYSDQLVVAGTVVSIVLAWLVSLAAGAVCGAVGGIIGRRRG